jgi:hypothetical protein
MDENYARERGLTPNRAHAELPLPEPRRPGRITPAPFDVDVEIRQFPGAKDTLDNLQIAQGSDPDSIIITPGTVNAGYPTIGGSSISSDPAPEITLSSGTTYVWLRTIATFGSPYSVTVETTGSYSPPSTPSVSPTGFTSCHYIGYVVVSSGVITSIVNVYGGGNLGVESFGAANLWWAI